MVLVRGHGNNFMDTHGLLCGHLWGCYMVANIDKTKPYWIVIKSTLRHYGYSIRDVNRVATYAIGPNFSCSWYKFKRDAIARCEALNRDNHTVAQ